MLENLRENGSRLFSVTIMSLLVLALFGALAYLGCLFDSAERSVFSPQQALGRFLNSLVLVLCVCGCGFLGTVLGCCGVPSNESSFPGDNLSLGAPVDEDSPIHSGYQVIPGGELEAQDNEQTAHMQAMI
jgi:hypothetical protein